MLVAQNSLGPVCPVPLTVRGTAIAGDVRGRVDVDMTTCDGMETSTGPHITVPLNWVTNGELNSAGYTYLRQDKITWWVSILYSDDDMNCFEKYPYHLVSSS